VKITQEGEWGVSRYPEMGRQRLRMPVANDIVETEVERVERWRAEELERAGYEHDDAVELAGRLDVDLHDAISLLERGCPADLAVLILR
jgi:hypothetical protein